MSHRVPSGPNMNKYYNIDERVEQKKCFPAEFVFWTVLAPLGHVLKMNTSTCSRKVVCVVASTAIVGGAGAAGGAILAGPGGAAAGAAIGGAVGCTVGILKVVKDESERNKLKREQLVPA